MYINLFSLNFRRQFFEFSTGLKSILANTGWLTFEKVFRMALGLLVGIVLARYLGPGKFGILNYAMSLVAFFGAFVYLGLSGVVIRDLVQQPKDKHIILGTTFVLKTVGGLMAFFVLSLAVIWTNSSATEIGVILIIGLTLFFRPFETIDFWFYAGTQAKFSVYSKSAAFLATLCTKLLIVFLGGGLISLALANAMEAALAAGLLCLIFQLKGQSVFSWKFDFSKAKQLIGQSWILVLSGFLATVYLKMDQIMLRWMISAEEVGQYSVAVSFSEGWYFIPSAIAMSVYPHLIKKKKKDELEYRQSLQKTMDSLFVISLFVSLIFTIVGPKLIGFLYGDPYQKAGCILMIHIWASIFVFMRGLFSKWVLIEDVLVFSLFTHGLGAVVNVSLNFVLIPSYAGYGAAFATLVSYAAASYLALFFHKRTRVVANMMTKSIFLPFRFFSLWMTPSKDKVS